MQKIHLTLTFFVSELTDDVFLPTNIRIGALYRMCADFSTLRKLHISIHVQRAKLVPPVGLEPTFVSLCAKHFKCSE